MFKNVKVKKIVTVVLLLTFLLLIGCTPAQNGEEEGAEPQGSPSKVSNMDIKIGTGGIGGNYYVVGAAISQALMEEGLIRTGTSQVIDGAVDGFRLLDRGLIDFVMVDGCHTDQVQKGEGPYDGWKLENIRYALPLYCGQLWFAAFKDSGIDTFQDVLGKNVVVGLRSGGMLQHLTKMMETLGYDVEKDINPLYLGHTDGITSQKDGLADVNWTSAVPSAAQLELAEAGPLKVVRWSDEEFQKIIDLPAYVEHKVPGGVLNGIDEDVPVPGQIATLICLEDTDFEMVYTVTKGILDNLDRIKELSPPIVAETIDYLLYEIPEKSLLDYGSTPLHPGAEKALKEAGILK